jgi:hypothetical protein
MNPHVTTRELAVLLNSDLLSAATKLIRAMRDGADPSRELAVLEREVSFIVEVMDYEPL